MSAKMERVLQASVSSQLLVWGSDQNSVWTPVSHLCNIGGILNHSGNESALSRVLHECQIYFFDSTRYSFDQLVEKAVRVLEVPLIAGSRVTASVLDKIACFRNAKPFLFGTISDLFA